MLKKTITFEDFDGRQVTEDFYFNLSKAELVELEVSSKTGFADLLQQIVASNDGQEIINHFKQIILMAYGKKSDDGRRFIKSQELRDEFEQTNAYSELFIELATNADAASAFMRGVVPADLVGDSDQPMIPNITPTAEVVELPEPKEKDLTKLTKKELLEELQKKNKK